MSLRKTWLFVTGITNGCYITVSEDGENHEHSGLDLNLGVATGETVQEAASKVLPRLKASLPEKGKTKIIAYEIIKEGIYIDLNKLHSTEPDDKVSDISKYKTIKCEWCGEELPTNGAAQFAHLRKHIRQLLAGKYITTEDVKTMNKVTLTLDQKKIFTEAKEKGALK